MSDDTVLVTGATGNVGSEVTRQLVAMGYRVRAIVRDPARAESLLPPHGVELHRFDFGKDRPAFDLFEGVRQLFLMRPPDIGNVRELMFPFLGSAAAAGVRHVVLLSLIGARNMPFIPHRKLEKAIVRLGMSASFLRAGFFMQNLDTIFRRFIRDHDELPVPAGGGRTSFVDARDIGEAAARLIDRSVKTHDFTGMRAFELTGIRALSYAEAASILSEELGRTISYTRPSLREFRRRAIAEGWAPDYARLVGRLFLTVRLGIAAGVTEELPSILGRRPRSFREYVRDYRHCWRKDG